MLSYRSRLLQAPEEVGLDTAAEAIRLYKERRRVILDNSPFVAVNSTVAVLVYSR